MRRKLIRISVAVLVAIAFIGCLTAAAQERRAFGNYPMSRINVPGTSNYLYIMDWRITKKKSSVVFAGEYDSGTNTERLVKYNLSQNGNASGYTTLLNVGSGWIIDAAAVWLGNAGASVGPAAKQKKTGLLFVVHTPTDSEETIIISVARFNDKGNLLGGFRQLRQFNVPENKYYYFGGISAALGANTVGVSWTYSLSEYIAGTGLVVTSHAYFFETGFQGWQIGGMSQVPIPKGGNNQFFYLLNPYWNGKGWLAPAMNARTTPSLPGRYDVLGNDIYIFSATSGKASRKLRLRLLYRDGQEAMWTYRAQFVPRSSGAAPPPDREAKAKKTSTLFLRHRNWIPAAQQTMNEYTVDCFLVQINRKGKRVGSATRVQIDPEWDHSMPYDPNKELIRSDDRFSNVIPAGDGNYYVAQARSTILRGVLVAPPNSYIYDTEHQYSLYSFDPQSGEVDIIARGSSIGETGYFSTPRIRWFNGNIAVINMFLEYPYDDDANYFSKFRP